MNIKLKTSIFVFLIILIPISIIGTISYTIAKHSFENFIYQQHEIIVKEQANKVRKKVEFILRENPLISDSILAGPVSEIIKEVKPAEGGFMFILDREGQVLVHPRRDKQITKENFLASESQSIRTFAKNVIHNDSGSGIFQDEEGEYYYVFYAYDKAQILTGSAEITARYKKGWKIILAIPTQVVVGPIADILNLTLITLVVSLVVTLLIAFTGVKSMITNKIDYFVAGAKSIKNRNFDFRLKISSKDEFKILGDTFNVMTNEIQALITNYRSAQERLNLLNKELEQRVEKRTLQLMQAKEKADHATQAKSDFLAKMSHEIRTPMNGVIAAAEMALEEKLTDKAEHFLSIIYSSGFLLLGIINNILDLSKIESGKLELETGPFMLDEIVKKSVDVFIKQALDKKIELLIDLDPGIPVALLGDSFRIQQIITNLVGNAIKFTPENGSIYVTITATEMTKQNVNLFISIKDTGIGIDPEKLEKLFKPFSQADISTTRKFGGTGLGLTISKQLVELMGGKISVESELEKGSDFNFSIKLKRQTALYERKLIIPDDLHSLNVLLVNDLEDKNQIMQKILNSFGYQVQTVSCMSDAFECLKNSLDSDSLVDLMIIDNNLFAKESMNKISKLHNELAIKAPIIVMSYFGEAKIVNNAKKIISAYLYEPFNSSTVFDTIMNVFGKDKERVLKKDIAVDDKIAFYKNQLKDAKILLVEDNLTNQEIASAVLGSAGISVDIANNGLEAINALEDHNYDAILMDLQMPEMDGYQATKKIRENHKFDSMPIIAMTAHAMKKDKDKCLKSGMNNYITKPINQNTLFYTLYTELQYSGNISSIDKS